MQHFMKSRIFLFFQRILSDFFRFLNERKQLLPIDQKAYAKDFQERYDNEFLQVNSFFLRERKDFFLVYLALE